MAREVDVLAGLRWEKVGDAGPCGAQTAAGAEAPLDPPVPPGIGRPHPDRARQFMPFAALREDMGIYDGVIRLHVLADSDEPEAQRLKLKVRDGILGIMDDMLDGTEDIESANAAI